VKLILAGAVLFLSGCSFSLDGFRFYRAKMQISQHHYASALPLLQKIVDDSPSDDRALQAARKGARVAHFEAKAYQQAVNFYKFIILKSDDVIERQNAQKNIAQIYFDDLQDFDQSVTEFERILKFDNSPDEAFRYRLNLAKAYFRLNNAEQALNELDVLLSQKLDSDKIFDILALKANVMVGNHKLPEAAQLWEKIIKDFPEQSKKEKIGLNLVVCYEELKQFDKAIEVLENMRPQYPNPDFLDLRISRLKERQYNQPGAQGWKR
jgi:tetratricopeptide (TPR) repeat protein